MLQAVATALATALLALAILLTGMPAVRFLFAVVGLGLLLPVATSWLDAAAVVTVALVVVAVVHTLCDKGSLPPMAFVKLTSGHTALAGTQLKKEHRATLIVMTGGSNGTHAREHTVTYVSGGAQDATIEIDRNDDDHGLDKLLDDLAAARTVYLMPTQQAKREKLPKRIPTPITVVVSPPPTGAAPSVEQTTVLSLSNCLGATRQAHDGYRSHPDPPVDPHRSGTATQQPRPLAAAQSRCASQAPRDP